jgi:Sec-independent protein translocase protein TatA
MDAGSAGDVSFLAFLVLLLFGPRKLPQIVKTVTRLVAELKRASSEIRGQFSREIENPEPTQAAKALSSLVDRIRGAGAINNPGKLL